MKHFLTLSPICCADFDVIFCTRDREGETMQDKNEAKEILDMLWNATETSRDILGWKYAINCPPSHSDFGLHSTWSTFKFYLGGNQKLEFARVVKSFWRFGKKQEKAAAGDSCRLIPPLSVPPILHFISVCPRFSVFLVSKIRC